MPNTRKGKSKVRLRSLAERTTKTLSGLIPGARQLANEDTPVVAAVFGWALFAAMGLIGCYVGGCPLAFTGGLEALLAVLGLAGGVLLCKVVPDRRRKITREYASKVLEGIEKTEAEQEDIGKQLCQIPHSPDTAELRQLLTDKLKRRTEALDVMQETRLSLLRGGDAPQLPGVHPGQGILPPT